MNKHKEKTHDDLFNFFSFTSRLIVFIPVIIIIVALILRFNQSTQQRNSNSFITSQLAQPTTSLINSTLTTKNNQMKIDLIGPLHCQYSDKNKYIEAWIKDKKVLGIIKANKTEKKYLLNGDCLFFYENNKLIEKKCGMSTYIVLGESLFNSGLIDLSTMTNQFPGLTGIDINQMIKSCKKEEIKDNIFDI